MSLAELFVSTVIFDIASSAGKVDVIERLLVKLAEEGHIGAPDVPTLSAGVMRRESLGSTGIGLGVAIPHTRHGSISRPIGILGVCRTPVDFDSIDGEPTDIFALLLAPSDPYTDPHRRASDVGVELLRLFGDRDFLGRLRRAESAEDLAEAVRTASRGG